MADAINLQATGKTARVATKITLQMNDFVFRVVQDLHIEASHASATESGAAVVVLDSVEQLVSLVVLNCVLVVRFETDEC